MKASNITKGMIILFKKEPYQVLDKKFFNLGRGRGHLKAKLRNVKKRNVIRYTFNSVESVEEVQLQPRELQYLYHDSEKAYFMDPKTFGQVDLDYSLAKDIIHFLKEGENYKLSFFEDKPIIIKIPPKVILRVTKAEEAVKGNTVAGASKEVLLETGFKLKVPLFIKKGDKLIINTETKDYVSRSQ